MANGRNFQKELNRILPTAGAMKLGDYIQSLAVAHNAVVVDLAAHRTSFNTLVAKLNADAGVTDTNYAVMAANTGAAVTLLSAL